MCEPGLRIVKFGIRFAVLLFLLGGVAVPTQAQVLQTENFCEVCHSDLQAGFRESVHAREGIRCVDCHGGDARAQDVASAHRPPFRRTFTRRQIAELCASCHADPERMKPYGIPIDQYALYQTSVHGRRLMAGDNRVAVCSDCHDAHRVLQVRDPRSPVFPKNIPQTCGRCHADVELMKDYGLPANVVDQYIRSVHGQALLQENNLQAPDCARCHGTHGAAPPGLGDVAKVCGQCHIQTLARFRESLHVKNRASMLSCISCHGHHDIETARHGLWDRACMDCHAGQEAATEVGQKIKALFIQAEQEIERARSAIARARQMPLDVSDYEAQLNDAWTYLVEARPVSHMLRVEDVEALARRARSIALDVQAEIHAKERVFRGRTLILILIWFYILLSISVIYRFMRVARPTRPATSAGTQGTNEKTDVP